VILEAGYFEGKMGLVQGSIYIHQSREMLQNLAVKEICINYYQQSSCPNGDASDPESLIRDSARVS
jgi:hypothetical protein